MNEDERAGRIRAEADARHYSWWWHLKWRFRLTKWGTRMTNWKLARREDPQTRQTRLAELERVLLAEDTRTEADCTPPGAAVPGELISHPQSSGRMRGER